LTPGRPGRGSPPLNSVDDSKNNLPRKNTGDKKGNWRERKWLSGGGGHVKQIKTPGTKVRGTEKKQKKIPRKKHRMRWEKNRG